MREIGAAYGLEPQRLLFYGVGRADSRLYAILGQLMASSTKKQANRILDPSLEIRYIDFYIDITAGLKRRSHVTTYQRTE